ncbi:MAG: SPOR domain-containing protein [Candidatus Omnitrophica bacterium]|nr:SPOR domain-containing protein [Candidatus Omnitrophota bacterium]
MAAQPVPEPERVQILEIDVPEEVVDELKYTIQVASFKTDTPAQREASWLKDKGYETFVLRKGDYSIVTVGQFNQAQEAKAFSQRLSQRYKDCLVRRF